MPLEHFTLKQMVASGVDATQESRTLAEKCRDYYDGKQYTEEEEKILAARKQPAIVDNLIKRKIDAMVGLEQRGRTDPVAHPREPGDEDAAEVATAVLRYIEETERVDQKASAFFFNICIEGTGGVEVVAEDAGDGVVDVKVNRIRWDELVYDPHSREADYSDAAYTGIMKWMTVDRAREYLRPYWTEGKDPEELDDMLDASTGDTGDTYEDRPLHQSIPWFDRKQQRVRIAQIYYRCDGQWYMTIFSGRGEITNVVSPWLDHKKQPCNPMVLATAYIDRDNNRYGFVSSLLGLQDEVNKRRSKLLHMINSRQTWGPVGAVKSVAKMKVELAKPDGHVEVNPEFMRTDNGLTSPPINFINNNDQMAYQAQLLQDARQSIDSLGPNAALMGQMGNQASGRAMMAAQQAGMAELAPIYDAKQDWITRVYRMIWARAKQVMTAPRFIRITGEMQAAEFIGLNQPVPMTDQMGQPMLDPMTGQPAMQLQNSVAEMDVDIIVDQAPDYATLRAEQFEKLADLVGKGIPIPPDALIKASDLHDKRELMQSMQGDPQQAELGLRAAMADVAVKEADVAVKQTQAEKNQASAAKDMASIPKLQADAQKTQIEAQDATFETTKKQVMASRGVIVQ